MLVLPARDRCFTRRVYTVPVPGFRCSVSVLRTLAVDNGLLATQCSFFYIFYNSYVIFLIPDAKSVCICVSMDVCLPVIVAPK